MLIRRAGANPGKNQNPRFARGVLFYQPSQPGSEVAPPAGDPMLIQSVQPAEALQFLRRMLMSVQRAKTSTEVPECEQASGPPLMVPPSDCAASHVPLLQLFFHIAPSVPRKKMSMLPES